MAIPPPIPAPPLSPRLQVLREIVVTAVALSGTGLLAYGSWLAYPPAGFIVAGAVLLAAGANGARR